MRRKTILQLCRELPDSEAELRVRWAEFGEMLSKQLDISDGYTLYPVGLSARDDQISAAKLATDALITQGWRFELRQVKWCILPDNHEPILMWLATLRKHNEKLDRVVICERLASTEQLARAACAACALLAIIAIESGSLGL